MLKTYTLDKHILFLSYDGLTDPLGSSQVLPYILGLEAKGYRYTVMSFEKPERYAEGRKTIDAILQGKNITWIPLAYHKSPPVLSTLWDVRTLHREIKKLHQKNPVDLMHCRSYITSLAGLSFKKKYNIPFVFDMRAFYADERADAGMWPKTHPLFGKVYSFFKKKEKEFLSHADHTVVLTHAGARMMREGKLTGTAFTGKLSVIPCCADMHHFNYKNITSEKIESIRRQLNITDQTFVLGYCGSVGTWYMLPQMLDYFNIQLQKRPDSLFLILTRDNKEEIIREAQKKGIPENKLYITPVSRDEMPAWLSVFTYSIFFILPSFSKQASSPTKQGELMGCGIPVICNANVGDTEEIVLKSSEGIVIYNFNESEYSSAVTKSMRAQADKAQIRECGISYYGLEDGINKYDRIYKEVLGL